MAKMQFHKEIKVSTGEYTNAQGEQKKSYVKIGALFINPENGNMSARLEVLPIPNSEGEVWLSFFDKYDESKQQAQHQATQQFGQAQQPQYNQQPQPQGIDPSMAPPAQPYNPQQQQPQQNFDANGVPF